MRAGTGVRLHVLVGFVLEAGSSKNHDEPINYTVRVRCCHCYFVFVFDLDKDDIQVKMLFRISGAIVTFCLSYSIGFPVVVF
jgi:hypothetical protein